MLAWLDQILIPLITSLYEAVGYLGLAVAMAVDASSFPVPSEFILPFAGFLVAVAETRHDALLYVSP